MSCVPAEDRRRDLPADRGRSLLAPAVVGAMRSVHVVVARHPRHEPEVLGVVAAHPLAEELLPAVTVLRHGRVGIRLHESLDGGIDLLVVGVYAGGGGEEEARDAGLARGHQEMGIDQHAQHAQGLVVLDEPHAAHVGGEVVDAHRALHGGDAVGAVPKIEPEALDVVEPLVPLLERLDVDGPQAAMALPPQVGQEVPADEAAGPAHHDTVVQRRCHDSLPTRSRSAARGAGRSARDRPGSR